MDVFNQKVMTNMLTNVLHHTNPLHAYRKDECSSDSHINIFVKTHKSAILSN